MSAAYVYEVYDRDERLIYVGSTTDVFRRMHQHVTDSWWIEQAHKVKASVFPTVEAARAEERRRIGVLHPRWNLHMLPPRHLWTQDRYHDYLTSRIKAGTASSRGRAWQRMAAEYRYRFNAELPIAMAAAS
jgi:excinuclease UvrABC nuclease subunit